MGELDVGTLTGRIEIEDQLSSGLELAAHKIEEFGAHFDGVMGSLAISTAVVVGGISAITGSIIALGVKGSEVNDVATNFDRLAGSTEKANDIMEEMRKGTMGTIDNFQLMTQANKLLQSGFKGTAQDFGTITKAARVLANEGFGSLPDVMAQVDRGMQTGIMRGPLMKSLHVDLTSAERAYADSMGKSSSELTKSQKLTADRMALLTGLKSIVAAAGEQEMTFGERIKAAGVSIQNWGIELAQSVAASSHIKSAFDAIGEALTTNFGGVGQTAIQVITGWIDKFADEVAKWGPVVIGWVSDFIVKVKEIYTTIKDYWDTAPQWFKNIATEAALAGGAVYLVSKALNGATGPDILSSMANLAQVWSVVGTNITKAAQAAKEWVQMIAVFKMEGLTLAVTSFGEALLALAATPLGIAALITGLAVALYKVGEAIHNAYKWWQDGKPMWDFFTQKEDDNFIRRWLGLSHALDTTADSMAYLNSQRSQLEGMMKKPSTGGTPLPEPPPEVVPLSTGAQSWLDKFKGYDLKKQVDDISAAMGKLNKDLVVGSPVWRELGAALDKIVSSGGTLTAKQSDIHLAWMQLTQDFEKLNKGAADGVKILLSYGEHVNKLDDSWLKASANQLTANASLEAARQSNFQQAIAIDQAVRNSSFSTFDQIETATEHYYDTKRQMEQDAYEFARQKQIDATKALIDGATGPNAEAIARVQESWKAAGDAALKAIDAQHGVTKVTTAIDQVNDALKRQHDRYGDTVIDLRRIENQARETYATMIAADNLWLLMTGKHYFSLEQIRQKNVEVQTATLNRFKLEHPEWVKSQEEIEAVGTALDTLGSSIGGATGQLLSQGAAIVHQWSQVRETLAKTAGGALDATQKLSAAMGVIAGIGGVISSTGSGGMGQRVFGGAIAGAGAGMAAGTLLGTAMGPATMGISIAVGALAGAIVGMVRAARAAAAAAAEYNVQLASLNTRMIETYGTTLKLDSVTGKITSAKTDSPTAMLNAAKLAQQYDVPLKMFGSTPADIAEINQNLTDLDAKIKATNDLANNLGLTWKDMTKEAANQAALKGVQDLLGKMHDLTAAGYKLDAIQSALAPDVNNWLGSALAAGVKIPPAMKPIIENLIKTHQLTEANARALMGMAEDGVPSLNDISDAAGRYGLQLDQLGPKVAALQITDQSNQIVKDFNTLTAAGASFDQIMHTTATDVDGLPVNFDAMSASAQKAFLEAGGHAEGMGIKIQGIVTSALTAGVAIPEGMKPIIQTLVDQGRLVDTSGNKLTDLSKLTFEKPIADKIDDLITKLDCFIDKISGDGGVASETTTAADTTATQTGAMVQSWGSATKAVNDYSAAIKAIPPLPPGAQSGGSPTLHAGGGMVYAASGWAASGSDTVPAMLTPGERVLTVEQNRAFERMLSTPTPTPTPPPPDGGRREQVIAVSAPVVIQIGREEIARAVVKTFVTAGGFA